MNGPYPDNDEKAADVPDSTLTNRQANELLAKQAERSERTILNEGRTTGKGRQRCCICGNTKRHAKHGSATYFHPDRHEFKPEGNHA